MRTRHNPRLVGFDYTTPGAYFITICTDKYHDLFGSIRDGKLIANRAGQLVAECWMSQPDHFPALGLDTSVIMPNHLHAVCWLLESHSGVPSSMIEIVQAFKSRSTKALNKLDGTAGRRVWQRSFHDHIIRDDAGLAKIRDYILTIPVRWQMRNTNDQPIKLDELERWLTNEYGGSGSGPSRATAPTGNSRAQAGE